MKHLVSILLAALVVASFLTARSLTDTSSDVPVLYWVTDPNPARHEQIRAFRRWLADNGHPDMIVRLDTANFAADKILIQGVSGVAGDILGHTGGANMRFRQAVGLLEDVTEWAREYGFSPANTYAAMEQDITVDGRQYAFPFSVSPFLFWVNLEVFERYGLPPPARRWTIEEFEAIGRELVSRANPPGELRRHFLAPNVDFLLLVRSQGGSIFNETQTRVTLDDPRVIRALETRYRWTFVDRLLPTAAEVSSFVTEDGYGGASFQLFHSGNYALLWSGRFALIQFRRFSAERIAAGRPPMQLAVSEPPHFEMPNTIMTTRAGAIYQGSPRKDLAKYFLAFLASEDYNFTIVRDADALPPTPKYTLTEEFLRPERFPNEWGCHEAFSEAARTIAIPLEFSPFILDARLYRIVYEAEEKYMNHRLSVQETVEEMCRRIETEIQRSVRERPELVERYERRLARQREIDARRREGRPVPLSWIDNPFHRHLYRVNGWAEPDD